MKTITLTCCALLATLSIASAAPLRTGFDYQGRLSDGAEPANGVFEFRFALFDAAVAGAQAAGPVTNANVSVADGLFNTVIDFGAAVFDGTQYWLEIGVRPNGSGAAFTSLAPRQLILPAPYALHALSAAGVEAQSIGNTALAANAVSADKIAPRAVVKSLNGLTDDLQLAVEGDLSLRVERNQIVLAPLVNCNTYSNCYWNLLGNGNLTAGVNFLGTIAGELDPLEFRVNNHRSLLHVFTGAATAPNLIGGYQGNRIVTGAGSTISGGGELAGINQILGSYGTVAGGRSNIVGSPGLGMPAHSGAIGGGHHNHIDFEVVSGTIGGGETNYIEPYLHAPTIGGGAANTIRTAASAGTIAGGERNTARGSHASIGGGRLNQVDGVAGTVAGGERNRIHVSAPHSVVGGGATNSILPNSAVATIGGGFNNVIGTNVTGATISGGRDNLLDERAHFGAIGGGTRNVVQPAADSATIGGGSDNAIGSAGDYAVISGGSANKILGSSRMDVIAGGFSNIIGTNTVGAAIGGGTSNDIEASASFGTIAGGGANAIRNGAFNSTIGGGANNVIYTNIPYATIPGGYQAAATNYGQFAYASGHFANPGDAQTSVYVVRNTTATNTSGIVADLFLDGAGHRIRVPADSVWAFDIMVAARDAGVNSATYHFRGLIENSGGVTVFPGAPLLIMSHEDVAGWNVGLLADNANDALVVRVTGSAAAPVRWVATVRTTEVMFP
jgi:hypothetical protein